MRNARPVVLSILCYLTACGHMQSQTPVDANGERGQTELSPCLDVKDRRECLAANIGKSSGRTLIRAVVEADGTISNAEIAISSGNTWIDQYALETVRKVSPVKNPLSKRVIFMIPFRTIPSNTRGQNEPDR